MLLFKIPNDKEGKIFLELLRKFQNREIVKRIRVRSTSRHKSISLSLTKNAKLQYGIIDEDIKKLIQNARMTAWADGYQTGIQYSTPYCRRLNVKTAMQNRRQFQFEME